MLELQLVRHLDALLLQLVALLLEAQVALVLEQLAAWPRTHHARPPTGLLGAAPEVLLVHALDEVTVVSRTAEAGVEGEDARQLRSVVLSVTW